MKKLPKYPVAQAAIRLLGAVNRLAVWVRPALRQDYLRDDAGLRLTDGNGRVLIGRRF